MTTDDMDFGALASAELHSLADKLARIANASTTTQATELGRLLYDGNFDSLRNLATRARRLALAAVTVEEGGIAPAARRLGMDSANLSRMVKNLGDDVAVRLPLALRGRRR